MKGAGLQRVQLPPGNWFAPPVIWTEGDASGWACSNCPWRFPIPTLLSGEETKDAYDRLAAVEFREHQCEAETSHSAILLRNEFSTEWALGP